MEQGAPRPLESTEDFSGVPWGVTHGREMWGRALVGSRSALGGMRDRLSPIGTMPLWNMESSVQGPALDSCHGRQSGTPGSSQSSDYRGVASRGLQDTASTVTVLPWCRRAPFTGPPLGEALRVLSDCCLPHPRPSPRQKTAVCFHVDLFLPHILGCGHCLVPIPSYTIPGDPRRKGGLVGSGALTACLPPGPCCSASSAPLAGPAVLPGSCPLSLNCSSHPESGAMAPQAR